MSDWPKTDRYGMSDEDWRWVRWEHQREHLYNRYKAIKAIWCKPVLAKYQSQYVHNESNRGDDWTLSRAIRATIGVLFDRSWTDKAQNRWRLRHPYVGGLDIAYWDARSTYGGYAVTVLWLYPRCRVSIFSDGESFL